VNGKAEYHPEGVYNLRYAKAGKRVWDAMGTDAQLAMTAKLRVEHKLQAVSLGMVSTIRGQQVRRFTRTYLVPRFLCSG
jgi:hypothetical protein